MGQPAHLDAAAKQRVKQALLARADAQLAGIGEAAGDERSGVVLDQEATFSIDDLAQSDTDAEIVALTRDDARRQQDVLAQIAALDVSPRTEVGPGAIVAFDGDHYVVGVVADGVEVDGVTYSGIAADAPIYPAIQGLHAGDTFTFRGADHRLDLVC